jgi:C4-dicarboxylate-specific signal transduction histidine kinase
LRKKTAAVRARPSDRFREENLVRTEKLSALGELASGLAHEINNPVAIMTSRLELMIRDASQNGSPPELLRDLETLLRHASRVGEITRRMLHFARTQPAPDGPVDLTAAAENVVRLVEGLLKKRGVRLETHLAPRLPRVLGSQPELEQVMLNLVKNAMEAVDGGPMPGIRVATWYNIEDGTVRFHVSDNGPGLPAGAAGKVFDPFFTTKDRGTGLGLSVSEGIVRRHGGKLTVPGKGPSDPTGTCFMMTLPRMDGEGA